MRTRILSGVIGLVLLLIIVTYGGILLDLSVFVISLIGLYEFNNALKKIDNLKPISSINYIFAFSLFMISILDKIYLFQLIIFVYTLSNLIILVFSEDKNPKDIGVTLLGGLYIPFFIFHISFLDSSIFIWLIFITAWATDTFGYFIGKSIGKRKLAPKLSPKKTVEGAIAGIVGSLVVTILFGYFFDIQELWRLGLLSLLCSPASIISDITASKIKRIGGLKDYGNIIPGHGGVLDRFDSILFTAPIVYYYITYFL